MCLDNLHSENIFWWCASFALFLVFQSLFIIGLNHCFKGNKSVDGLTQKEHYTGMVFYMVAPKFFEKAKYKEWSKPVFSCYRCMSSLWGLVTFWTTALLFIGFHWFLVPMSIWDVFALVSLNGYIYKKV